MNDEKMGPETVARFWMKASETAGCWHWTGAHDGRGYGLFRAFGSLWRAPRFAVMLTQGPIPKGLDVCHRCDNPRCVRPSHLFLGTRADNMKDCISKNRMGVHPGKSRITHCPKRHPYSTENTIRTKLGHRKCRACDKVSRREKRAGRALAKEALSSTPAPTPKEDA